MCPATEHEERKLSVEYLEKLKLYENNSVVQKMLPHPLERDKDSWMSESQVIFNRSSLYYHDIAKYLDDHLAPTFISQLESEYKLGKAYRYFSCEFVRGIIYFDLANTDLCILKSKIVPCQRINNKPYDVWAILQKDTVDKPGGDILSAYFTCTAGLQSSCNHIVGMLFRIVCCGYRGNKTNKTMGNLHLHKSSFFCKHSLRFFNLAFSSRRLQTCVHKIKIRLIFC